MNVYDQAHGLAQAIKASQEFIQYDALKKQVDANPELAAMVKDVQAKQFELQAKQMMGEQMNDGAGTAALCHHDAGPACHAVHGSPDALFSHDE